MARVKRSTVILVAFFSFYTTLSEVKAFWCRYDSDCTRSYSSSKYCCHRSSSYYANVCSSSCVGYSCDSDSDCAPHECCETLAGWIIAVIVISIVVVVVIPIAVVIFCCCCATKRPAQGGVIVAAPVVATNPGQPIQFQNPQPYSTTQYHPQGTAYPAATAHSMNSVNIAPTFATSNIKY